MLSNDQWLRLAMLAVLLVPCIGICVWAYYAAPVDPITEPDNPLPHPLPVPCLRTETEEHESDFMGVPAEHEAVRQIKEVMEGKVTLCAVCYGKSDALYRVHMADDSAFCCSVCAELLRAGSLT